MILGWGSFISKTQIPKTTEENSNKLDFFCKLNFCMEKTP